MCAGLQKHRSDLLTTYENPLAHNSQYVSQKYFLYFSPVFYSAVMNCRPTSCMVGCSVQTIVSHLLDVLKFAFKIVLVFHLVVNRWQHYVILCLYLTKEWILFINIHQRRSKNKMPATAETCFHLNVAAKVGNVPFKYVFKGLSGALD
jgi:hypothetical protein